MKTKFGKPIAWVGAIGLIGIAAVWATARGASPGEASPPAAQQKSKDKERSMQAVTAERAQRSEWQFGLSANGNIAAWQEMPVGSELGGLRLAEVNVNAGDAVRKGQVLARFSSDGVNVDLLRQQAALEEARAALAEAEANAEGARKLSSSGAMSGQQTLQYLTAERSAKARLQSAEARVKMEQIRLHQTAVLAPDDGVVLSRSVTVGAVPGIGQEMFRLIRRNRLEWRAEVSAIELLRIQPGQAVELRATNGATLKGTVRAIAPSVDPATRNAVVYADLPVTRAVRAGMFATGQFVLGQASAVTVPHAAVVTRDGFSYVFVIGADGKVAQTKVATGRRTGDRVELTSGVGTDSLLVNQGAGFLADGDAVRIATAMSSPKQAGSPATPASPTSPVSPVSPASAASSAVASAAPVVAAHVVAVK